MDHLKIRGTIGFDVLNLIGVLELSSQLKTFIFETCFGISRCSCRGHLSVISAHRLGQNFWRNGYEYRGTNPSILSKNKYVKNVFEWLEMFFI